MEEKPFVKEVKKIYVGENKDIEVILPRLTLKKIMAVTDGMDRLIKAAKEKSPEFFDIFSGGKRDDMSLGLEIIKVLPSVLPVLMHEITHVLGIYLNKEPGWVEDNFDMEDLVAVATPFFDAIFEQGGHLTTALSHMFPANKNESENQKTSPEQLEN